jgi:hypothetical protein
LAVDQHWNPEKPIQAQPSRPIWPRRPGDQREEIRRNRDTYHRQTHWPVNPV